MHIDENTVPLLKDASARCTYVMVYYSIKVERRDIARPAQALVVLGNSRRYQQRGGAAFIRDKFADYLDYA